MQNKMLGCTTEIPAARAQTLQTADCGLPTNTCRGHRDMRKCNPFSYYEEPNSQ